MAAQAAGMTKKNNDFYREYPFRFVLAAHRTSRGAKQQAEVHN
jgi:hypothetical protein